MTQTDIFQALGGQLTESKADRNFREFHEANPEVYKRIVALARQAKERGHKKISIELLINVIRWEQYLETSDTHSHFKINNNYKSRYSRLIMDSEDGLDNVFNIRELQS